MEVVDFGTMLFHDINPQDNPAYGKDDCIMIVKNTQRQNWFSVLRIEAVENAMEDESVTTICECHRHENTVVIAELFASKQE